MEPQFINDTQLLPAIIQNALTGKVLMLGYMNQEAFTLTKQSQTITFFSRSRNKLWTKGATSGNYLRWTSYSVDCDQDAILFQVIPDGPTCHTGAASCFENAPELGFLGGLENLIQERLTTANEDSYVWRLTQKGTAKIAQKVGEEAVETVIEALQNNSDRFKEETADLVFHLLLLLNNQNVTLKEITAVLYQRNQSKAQ